MWVELRRVHARGRARSPYPHRGVPEPAAGAHPCARQEHARTLRERGGRTPWGARQARSSLEPWSIAFRIWSACVVLGSSLRSSATNSSRLALMPRTSSNEAKYASASATDNLNAFGSSVSTKETIRWMQSSRTTMTPWSRGPVRQSRCAPLRGLEFHPHLHRVRQLRRPRNIRSNKVVQSPVKERTNGRCSAESGRKR